MSVVIAAGRPLAGAADQKRIAPSVPQLTNRSPTASTPLTEPA